MVDSLRKAGKPWVMTEDPPFLMCGGSLSVHGSAAIGPRFFRLLVDQLIGARGGDSPPLRFRLNVHPA
jgi:hypothetical protein